MEPCSKCSGSGMAIGDNGDPGICRHCLRDGLVHPHQDLIDRLNDMRCRADTQKDYATIIEVLNYLEAQR